MPGELAGQVTLVTGGGRGVGRTIAEALAGAGAAVAVAGRSAPQLAETVSAIEAAGGQALAHTADVTRRHDVQRLVEAVQRQLGTIDLLVANAGIIEPLGPFWETDLFTWWQCLQTNLFGAVACAHAVLPGMIARRHGRIITLYGGRSAPQPNFTAYASAKAALLRFTENLAAETSAYGVQVFALHPGMVQSEMSATVIEFVREQTGRTPHSNFMPPELAGEAAVLLASGRADALSGRLILVEDRDHPIETLPSHAGEIQHNDLYVLRARTLATDPA